MQRAFRWSVGLMCLGFAGCVDGPLSVQPVTPVAHSDAVLNRLLGDVPTPTLQNRPPVGRFSVDLRVVGDLRLGTPVTLEYTVTANVSTANARIALSAPDVDVAALNAWRPRGRARPADERVPEKDGMTMSLAAGQSVTRRTHLSIQSAGYYRVIVTASAPDEPILIAALGPVQNFERAEVGIFLDEGGSRVTQGFDPALLPDTLRRVAGVRQLRDSRFTRQAADFNRNLTTGPTASTGSFRLRTGSPTSISSTLDPAAIGGRIRYFDPESQTIRPVGGLRYKVEIEEVPASQIIYSYLAYTDPEGNWAVPCPGHNEYVRVTFAYDGTVRLPQVPAGSGYADGVCAFDEGDWLISSDLTTIWIKMSAVVQASTDFFGGWVRPLPIDVTVHNNSNQLSYFHRGDLLSVDLIVLRQAYPNEIYGGRGTFVMAHEFGHAQHVGAFGAYPQHLTFLPWIESRCPETGHAFEYVVSAECAYVEGFADFHAVATMPQAVGNMRDSIETGNFWSAFAWQTVNGRFNEGTVAAFLYDLVDPANEAHDSVQFSGHYVAKVIATCDAKVSGWWQHGRDIGWNVMCFEQQRDPFYVPQLGWVGDIRESAVEPPSWNRSQIRRVWLKTLFNQDPLAPLPPAPPSLSVQIAGWSDVRPSYLCHWEAIVNGGTEPFRYAWEVNGELVGDDASWLHYTNAGSSFTLSLIVSDGVLVPGVASVAVTVSSGVGDCPIY